MANNNPGPKIKGLDRKHVKRSYSHERLDPKTPRPKLPSIKQKPKENQNQPDK